GNASDFSGNGYDATPRAATSFQGHLGSGSQALNLYDTSSSKIVLAGKHAQNLNFDTKHDPFTVSVWLYNISAPTKDVPVITDRGPTSSSPYAYRLYYQYPKGLTLEIWDGVNTPVLVEYAFTPTASSWTHIAFTNDTNAITLYVNGNRQTPVTLPTYLGSTKNTDTLITMGQDVISGKSMNGGLDDIRIYNMCLSTGSIDSLYHLGGYSVTTNNAPVFSTDTAAGSFNRTGTVNNTYSVNVVATDIDGDQVNYIVLTPSGATCTASGVFSFTPTTSGDTRVSIIADDSKGGSDTLTWTVTVNNYITWKKTIGTPDAELGMAVQRTLDGGYIITGTHQANSIDDLYLLKTDSNGTEEWSKHFYGPARAFGYSVVATSDGGYIVAGSLKTATGNEDILIIKTDAVGDKIWEKTYGTAGYDEAVHNIKSTNDGGFILVGSAGGDVYVMKLYQNGDSAWTKSFNLGSSPPNYDAGNSIEQTSDGGYIIAAYTTWNVGGNDAYVIKLDQSGNKTWDKVFILADHQELYSIEQTVDGGYIATGYNSTNSGAIYIMKLNNNGDTTWTKSIDGVSTERSYSVKQTSDGGYVIAGETLSEGSGLNDGYIIKTNSDGTVLWARTYGTSNNDYFRDLQLTTDGGFIIVGFADDGTSNNVFLVKTDSVGLVK
ncbi:MAG: LamG domain-containing protein, partial [Fibrobacteres bacterium]|nr:LamG domain-containing protein [Fibrobacterota bacterium]